MSFKDEGAPEIRHLSPEELRAALQHGTAETSSHLQSCNDCAAMLRRLQVLSVPSVSGENCIAIEDLVSFAGEQSIAGDRQLEHLATCRRCAGILQDLIDDLSDEGRQDLAALASSSPQWQRSVARQMAAAISPSQRQRKAMHASRFRWAWASVTVAVVIGIVFGGLKIVPRENLNSLLAAAYSEHRVLEMRFPGVPFAPLSTVQRGNDLSRTHRTALLQFELEIAKHGSNSDVEWVQAQGRADLLEGNYDSAIQTLQHALQARPDSASIMSDLATAYFQRGEANDRGIDYGTAAELLSKALIKKPNDPVLLFNRGVVYNRLHMYEAAVDDFNAVVNAEKDENWRNEARKYLADIAEKKTLGAPH